MKLKSLQKAGVLLVFLLVYTFCFSQTTLVLQPGNTTGKNAMIINLPEQADSNYGGWTSYVGGAWTWSSVPGIKRTLMQFDLSSIPANANVHSATLSLTTDSTISPQSVISGSNSGWLKRITEPWNEQTVTWNNQPATTDTNAQAIDSSVAAYENYPDIDVSNMVQDMVNDPSHSFGIMIMLQTEVYYRNLEFASCHFSDSTIAPRLQVVYTTGNAGIVENGIAKNQFTLFPTPVSDILSIKQNQNENGKIEIFDMIGQLLYAQPVTKNIEQVNVAFLPNDCYIVKCSTSNSVLTQKIIKY